MSEHTKTATETVDAAAEAQFQTDPEAGLGGAAGFADAETREILNLLDDAESGGACCGGSCCSA
jgi:hypothetical protein